MFVQINVFVVVGSYNHAISIVIFNIQCIILVAYILCIARVESDMMVLSSLFSVLADIQSIYDALLNTWLTYI